MAEAMKNIFFSINPKIHPTFRAMERMRTIILIASLCEHFQINKICNFNILFFLQNLRFGFFPCCKPFLQYSKQLLTLYGSDRLINLNFIFVAIYLAWRAEHLIASAPDFPHAKIGRAHV